MAGGSATLGPAAGREGAPDTLGWFRRRLARQRLTLLLLVLAVAAAFALDVVLGPSALGLPEILAALGDPQAAPPLHRVVLFDLRLPSAVAAVLVGCCLAVSGAGMQAILNNPLADPYTMGLSYAAGFGAALAIVFGVSALPFAGIYVITANAFVFAFATALTIYVVGQLKGAGVQVIVLLGIAFFFTFIALLGLMQYLADADALQEIVFWMFGSLGRARWDKLALVALVMAGALPWLWRRADQLTALRLGDLQAKALGVPVGRVRLEVLLCVSLLAATVVAVAGPIGFIGLVAPHIGRLLVGEDQRRLLPVAALVGALVLVLADIASKAIQPGTVIPIGLVTTLIGLPIFMTLILRSRAELWR